MYRSYNLILVSYIFIKVCIDLVLTTQAGGGRANKIPSSEIAASTNNVNITKYINKYNIYIYNKNLSYYLFFLCTEDVDLVEDWVNVWALPVLRPVLLISPGWRVTRSSQ